MSKPSENITRTRLRSLRDRLNGRIQSARTNLAVRLNATVETQPVTAPLDAESAQWLKAHNQPYLSDEVPSSTAMVFADQDVQQWMRDTLNTLGWDVNEPLLVLEGWVPARNENTATGQPFTTYATGTKTSAAFARKNDPKTSKSAGAIAAASQSVTVNSHQGRLLREFDAQHRTNAGVGFTAAEAVNAAGLLTDGMHGSPWHRVTDLRDMGLITYLLDSSGQRTTRKNGSNSEADVLVVTPLGLRASVALTALADHGYLDYPLNFDGPTADALFEDLPATLARIDDLPVIDAAVIDAPVTL